MLTSEYTRDPAIAGALDELRSFDRVVSDLTDGFGNQYVDLVMEGGGVLGIALVGYAYGLEQAGIRFRSIGGTSAGAITACLLAAADAPNKPRAEAVLGMLSDLDMFSFIDGGDDAEDLVKDFIIKKRGLVRMVRAVARNVHEIVEYWGMNPGEVFQNWVHDKIAERGCGTTAELIKRMNAFPRSMTVAGESVNMKDLPAALKVVATEITTASKIVFPDMAPMFYSDADNRSPASFVHASMAVPYFFEPVRLRRLPRDNAAREGWKAIGFEGEPPTEAIFLDGGLLSNFPISLFHSHRVPRLPTFGAKLGESRRAAKPIGSALAMGGAMFNASRQAADLDFIWRNPDYKRVIAAIELDGDGDSKDDVHWLNFKLSNDDKRLLFRAGVRAARDFLFGNDQRGWERFDWKGYKKARRKLIEAE